jgi:hypothetical protein
MKRKLPDDEIYIDSFCHDGFTPLLIVIGLNFIQDETNDSAKGSRFFWTYEMVYIRATYKSKIDGGPVDYLDYMGKEYQAEIEEACLFALYSFKRGVA